jgi:MATE family multidrug resistance protein
MPNDSHSWPGEARALAGIATAISLTMFAQLAISAIETVIVARLGIAALAGVTLALGLYSLVFLFALGVVTAVTPIVAAAIGRGDGAEVRRSGQQGFWVGLGFSLPGMALLLGVPQLVGFGHGAEAAAAAAYLTGAGWGLPAWVAYVGVRCLAVATGRVRVSTAIMLAAVPVHAALAWAMVFGVPALAIPPLGVFGAGLAYALTAFAALALLALLLWWRPDGAFASVFRRPLLLDRTACAAILRLGLPFACRIVLREGVLPAAAFAVAPFGAAALAAHAVAARVVELAGVFSFGFSDAANVRVSAAIGAGAPRRARHAAVVALCLASAVSAAVAATIMLIPSTIAGWVLGRADVTGVAAAAALLPIAAVLLFLDGVQSAAGGALAGLRDARGPLLIAIFGGWGVGLPAGMLLARHVGLPAAGMWGGLVIGAVLTTALYLHRLRRARPWRAPGDGAA